MSIRLGDRVRIRPLQKRGRVVGIQPSKRIREVLYLVRYELGEDEPDRRSRQALYVAEELVSLSADPRRRAQSQSAQASEAPAEPSDEPLAP